MTISPTSQVTVQVLGDWPHVVSCYICSDLRFEDHFSCNQQFNGTAGEGSTVNAAREGGFLREPVALCCMGKTNVNFKVHSSSQLQLLGKITEHEEGKKSQNPKLHDIAGISIYLG